MAKLSTSAPLGALVLLVASDSRLVILRVPSFMNNSGTTQEQLPEGSVGGEGGGEVRSLSL